MAGWPDIDTAKEWIGPTSVKSQADRLPLAFDAALATTQDAVDDALMPDDGSVPSSVRLAVLVLTARLMVRADAPVGGIGIGEEAFRISRTDPDVMSLLAGYTLDGIA